MSNAILNNRYVPIDGLTEIEAADAVWRATGDPRWAPENRCGDCHHPKDNHLDASDRGWCTKPTGTCIFNPCNCKTLK